MKKRTKKSIFLKISFVLVVWYLQYLLFLHFFNRYYENLAKDHPKTSPPTPELPQLEQEMEPQR